MKNKRKILLRVTVFTMVFVALFSLLNNFFQPVWLGWNNYYTTYGFYEEPDDTIETVFLGASVVVTGVSPTELYDKHGICSYNLGTEQQPILTSYYWLEETYRLHSETLKTVVLEVSTLRSKPNKSFYHKALDAMELSDVKIRAVKDHVGGGITDILTYLTPLATYHTRWSELESTDFEKHTYDAVTGTRGYQFLKETYADRYSWDRVKVKETFVDKAAEPATFYEEPLKYLEKTVDFCKEKGIKLVLMKAPARNWTSEHHNAAEALAKKYSVEFLDFSFAPLYNELNSIHAVDSYDGIHLNYYGASKLTDWLGKYLVEKCDATDVRGMEKYSHMEEQLSEYKERVVQSVELEKTTDISEYLKTAISGDNTVFIAVKDEATNKLTEKQRACFADIGLKQLSQITYRDSYLAVINGGDVTREMIKVDSNVEEPKALSYDGKFNNDTSFSIKSGGHAHGNVASCLINGEEYAVNKRGINVIVYNNNIGEVIDSTVFDTFDSSERESYSFETVSTILSEPENVNFAADSFYGKIVEYQAKVAKAKKAESAETK